MAASSAVVIDLQAYRDARRAAEAPAPASTQHYPFQPVMMWMPVWGMVPVIVGPWHNGW